MWYSQDVAEERNRLVEWTKWSSPWVWLLLAVVVFAAGALTATATRGLHRAPDRCAVSGSPLALDGCDLTDRSADLQAADLRDASMRGARLDGVRLQRKDLDGVHLEGASLRNVNWSAVDLSSTWLTGADLRAATFSDSCLRGVRLQRADLTDVTFTDTDASSAETGGALNFRSPPRPRAEPEGCHLSAGRR